MVFTGVRLSWVAFRLGAMINYEFSNLLHNEVTPSNPIKENHQDPHFFLVNIYFPGILSLFLSCLQTRHMYFFPLKENKIRQWLPLKPCWMMATFYASKVTQDWLSQEVFKPVVGHSSACLAGTGVRSDGQVSVAFGWHLAGIHGQVRETCRF